MAIDTIVYKQSIPIMWLRLCVHDNHKKTIVSKHSRKLKEKFVSNAFVNALQLHRSTIFRWWDLFIRFDAIKFDRNRCCCDATWRRFYRQLRSIDDEWKHNETNSIRWRRKTRRCLLIHVIHQTNDTSLRMKTMTTTKRLLLFLISVVIEWNNIYVHVNLCRDRLNRPNQSKMK